MQPIDSDTPICLEKTAQEFIVMLGSTHMLSILHVLCSATAPIRFNEMKRHVSIPATTLSRRLDELLDVALVHREVFAEVPARVEYSLSESGVEFKTVLLNFFGWIENHSMNKS